MLFSDSTSLFAIDGIYLLLTLLGMVISLFADLLFSQCYYVMLDFEEYTGWEVMKAAVQLIREAWEDCST